MFANSSKSMVLDIFFDYFLQNMCRKVVCAKMAEVLWVVKKC